MPLAYYSALGCSSVAGAGAAAGASLDSASLGAAASPAWAGSASDEVQRVYEGVSFAEAMAEAMESDVPGCRGEAA